MRPAITSIQYGNRGSDPCCGRGLDVLHDAPERLNGPWSVLMGKRLNPPTTFGRPPGLPDFPFSNGIVVSLQYAGLGPPP
jgi:hypothetical protein